METAEAGILWSACRKVFTRTLHTSLLWLISCARMKYSKSGLELANSSRMRIDSHNRSSAGVNQHNPIEAKGAPSIYSTKRSGLKAFKNHMRKTNPPKKKKNNKRKHIAGNLFFYPKRQLWFSFPKDVLIHPSPLGAAHKAFLHCCPFSVRFHSHQPFSLGTPLLIKRLTVIQ